MAQKGKTPAERLSEVRDRIAELEEERDALKDHPVSRDEALARFEEWLEARQGEFDRDVNVAGLLKNKANLSLSVVRFGNGERDVVPALAKIMPDALRATVTDKLDAALADREPMSTEERDKRAAELDQKLLEANREEERII